MNNNKNNLAASENIQKVAILGGGPSALSAAFELSDPAQGGRYDVTLYQLGWRLGGKCASGRNAGHHERVQEHGLHVFLGSYDNAFELLRRAYGELDRNPDAPLSTWDKAVIGIDQVGLLEKVDGEWRPWVVKLPRMPGLPGDEHGGSFFDLLASLLQWIGDELSHHAHHLHHPDDGHAPPKKRRWWNRLLHKLFPGLETAAMRAGGKLLGAAATMTAALAKRTDKHEPEHHHRLASLLHTLRDWLHKRLPQKLEDGFRHFVIMFDLILSNGIGALRDGLIFDTEAALPKVNELDYRAWLRKHHALEITVESAIVRGLYDLIFAYPEGDVGRDGDVEAGTMFISLIQTSRYHASFMWKMMSGTGDVFAGPLYEVMKRRGVRFEFFHRVTGLAPSEDGNWIQQVRISRQVKLKNGEYQPLKDIGGLPSWPSEPRYGQIVEGEQLQKGNIDLESRWTPWVDTGGELVLEFGRDYDALVLGTSVEPLHELCSTLVKQNERWRNMLENMETVQTQSVQLWFQPALNEGAACINPELVDGLVLGAYDRDDRPIDTWADISEVLDVETWPAGMVGNESVICGPMKGPKHPPPPSDRDFPSTSENQVVANLDDFIANNGEAIWPGLYSNGEFEQEKLVDRYLRVNIDPSERYVLTRPNSTKYRMRAQDSGYRNLFLTGDWIQNGQNLGSFEASVVSGKLASRAISGRPENIARIPRNSPLYRDDPPPQSPVNLPGFVEHPFLQTFPGAVELANTNMWSFWLPGDMEKLKKLCQDCFAKPSGGDVEYVPITSQVLVSVVDIGAGRFLDVPEMGWSSERELSFWILMAKVRREGGVMLAERLGLFNPLLVLDNPVAVATGRETYGYLKQQGWIDVPDDGQSGNPITVDAFATERFGPDTEQQKHRFLSLQPVGDSSHGIVKEWHSLEEIAAAVREALSAEFEFLIPTLELAEQLFGDMVHKSMPQVFLKQFRDVADTRRACYQAIIETPIRVSNIRGAQLARPYDMKIEQLDSLDVAKVLGVPIEHRIEFMMKLKMDMTLDTGQVIWKAP